MYHCDNIKTCGWIGNEHELLRVPKNPDRLCPDCAGEVTEHGGHTVADVRGVPDE